MNEIKVEEKKKKKKRGNIKLQRKFSYGMIRRVSSLLFRFDSVLSLRFDLLFFCFDSSSVFCTFFVFVVKHAMCECVCARRHPYHSVCIARTTEYENSRSKERKKIYLANYSLLKCAK